MKCVDYVTSSNIVKRYAFSYAKEDGSLYDLNAKNGDEYLFDIRIRQGNLIDFSGTNINIDLTDLYYSGMYSCNLSNVESEIRSYIPISYMGNCDLSDSMLRIYDFNKFISESDIGSVNFSNCDLSNCELEININSKLFRLKPREFPNFYQNGLKISCDGLLLSRLSKIIEAGKLDGCCINGSLIKNGIIINDIAFNNNKISDNQEQLGNGEKRI